MSREVIMIILDVGRSMCEPPASRLAGAIKAVKLLVQQKILHRTKDELGIVLFGTQGTRNNLAEDGYEHITVFSEIDLPSVALLRRLDEVQPEGADGDFVDALIVAMDMLIQRAAGTKAPKRIFLVTDGGCPVDVNDLPVVVTQFQKMQARLNVIGVDFAEVDDEDSEDDDEEESSSLSTSSTMSSTSSMATQDVTGIASSAAAVAPRVQRATLASSIASSTTPSSCASAIKVKNEQVLRQFARDVDGTVFTITNALALMSILRSRAVLQRPVFTGCLEIGHGDDAMWIPVRAFLKSRKTTMPTMKKMSLVAKQAAEELADGDADEVDAGSMAVVMERTYHYMLDPDQQVDKEDLIKGYKYGKTLVPFSAVDESVLKYQAEKCLQVIGFTEVSNVPRHYFMSNGEVFISNPGDAPARLALSALVHALVETDMCAVVRYVKRNNAAPWLAVMLPWVRSDYDCLLLHRMPFAEDIRDYSFPSLVPSRMVTESHVPSQEQLDAMDRLIGCMDLMTAHQPVDDDGIVGEPSEALRPKSTFNPVLQHFYQTLQLRAEQPHAPIPPLDPLIKAYCEPDQGLQSKAEPALDAVRRLFPLTPVAASSTAASDGSGAPMDSSGPSHMVGGSNVAGTRRFWHDAMANLAPSLQTYIGGGGGGGGGAHQDATASQQPAKKKKKKLGPLTMRSLVTGGVASVGSVNPAEDFRQMLARRDVDLVDDAIAQLGERIVQLVNDSVGPQLYAKALECAQALRQGCVREDEAVVFNAWLRKVKGFFQGKRRNGFWLKVVEAGLCLIHTEESGESDVTQAQAMAFLHDQASAAQSSTQDDGMDQDSDEAEALFDELE